MTAQVDRDRFQSVAEVGGDRATSLRLAAAARAGDAGAVADLAALVVHVAALAPEALVMVYDGAAEGWLGRSPVGAALGGQAVAAELAAEFWPEFWELVLDPEVGRDAADITMRTAALAGLMTPAFGDRLAVMASSYPGVAGAAAMGYPEPFALATLARCPQGSLGGDLHHLIVDNGFDLEVLDRGSLGLAQLPAPLDYLNARILQCHDLWHLMGGYGTTILHEVAISGFQLGQFGHHYSSMFLAVTLSKVALTQPLGVGLMLDTILSGWTHGRETPSLLGVPWEDVWHLPADSIRVSYGVQRYDSPYPADLVEQMMAG